MTPKETLYDILGVGAAATTQEIVDAYRRLARRVHPDVGGTAALFRQVETAHAVLSDPTRRAAYDEPVRSNTPTGTGPRHAAAPNFTAPNVTAPGRDGIGRDGTGGDGTAPNVTGRDGTARDGTARDGTARDGTARDGTARDGTARDGTARDGTARDGTASGPEDRVDPSGAGSAAPPAGKRVDAPPGEVAWPALPDRIVVLDVLRRWARTKRLFGNDTFDDLISVEDATLCEVEIDRLIETRWEEQGVTPGQGVQFPLYTNLYHVSVPPPTTVRGEHTWSLAKQGSVVVRECPHNGRGPGGRDSCPECARTGYVTEFRSGKIQRRIVRCSLARASGLHGPAVSADNWRSFGPFSGVRPPSGISLDLHRDLGYELSKHPPGELLRELRGKLMPATAVTYRKKRGDGRAFILGDDNEVRVTSAPQAAVRS